MVGGIAKVVKGDHARSQNVCHQRVTTPGTEETEERRDPGGTPAGKKTNHQGERMVNPGREGEGKVRQSDSIPVFVRLRRQTIVNWGVSI